MGIQLDLLRGNIITIIMIAKIALVSMLAAVAVAAPEPQLLGLPCAGGAVASHVPPACTPSTEEIEIQSCAPRAENICSTADVVSEEITYEKRCKEVVNKHCAGVVGHAGLIVKREAEAEADAQILAGVPLIKEVVTPVETCHVVTKVDCTPAVHSIPKVTCEAGTTEVVHHVPAAVGYHHLG